MADQRLKDDHLRHFDYHRKYPGMPAGDSWARVSCPHLKFNAVLVLHTACTVALWHFGFGIALEAALMRIVNACAAVFVMHGGSHFLATLSTGGQVMTLMSA